MWKYALRVCKCSLLYNYKLGNYAQVIIFAFIPLSANKELMEWIETFWFCYLFACLLACFWNMTVCLFLCCSMIVYISEDLEILNID